MPITKKYVKSKEAYKVTFELEAANASEVCVVGTFNDWGIGEDLFKKSKDGVFKGALSLKPGSYEFRYLIDGDYADDQQADGYVQNIYGTVNNIIVLDPVEVLPNKTEKPVKKAKKKKGVVAKDDLKKIEGIGPKAAKALNDAGVANFQDLSKMKPVAIRDILVAASSRLAHLVTDTWPKQSKLAADGKWEQLKALQDKLNGGVE